MSIALDRHSEALCGHSGPITSFSAHSNFLLSGSEDKSVRLWDLRTRKSVRRLSGIDDEISSVAFNSLESQIVYAASGQSLCMYDLRGSDRILINSSTIQSNGHHSDDINQVLLPKVSLCLDGSYFR
eukprot:TRINITY_DN6789_c0_g1_i2.p1 TRINITY_DN6789_c0_g1~~TRINITY_DN6789_c0_g1_i2.p1  ORF type:complete len:127 (-),score=18.39 TRINITY_DN6789_c0_g1_i2:117-497(-)